MHTVNWEIEKGSSYAIYNISFQKSVSAVCRLSNLWATVEVRSIEQKQICDIDQKGIPQSGYLREIY